MLYNALKNHKKLVDLAKQIAKTKVTKMDESELQSALQVFADNNVALPSSLCLDLVTRHTESAISKNDFGLLLDIVNPFIHFERFFPQNPLLPGITAPVQSKLDVFGEVVIEKVFVDWLQRGAAGSHEVFVMSEKALAKFADVDLVDLDTFSAKELADLLHIWRACKGLYKDDFAEEAQDLKLDHLRSLLKAPLWAWNANLCIVFFVVPLSPEEAILKVKNGVARAAKTSLALVASTIEATEWWSEKMHAYLDELPAMKEWMPKVAIHMAGLDVEHTIPGFKAVALTVQELHTLMAGMRPQRTKPLVDKVFDTAKCLSKHCLAPEVENGMEKIELCQNIFQELSIIRPMDLDVQHILMALSTRLNDMNIASRLKELADIGEKFNQGVPTSEDDDGNAATDEDLQNFIVAMHDVSSALLPCPKTLTIELSAVFDRTVHNLVKVMVKQYCADMPLWPLKFLNMLLAIAESMCFFMDAGNNDRKLVMAVVQVAADLVHCMNALKPEEPMSLDDMVAKDTDGMKVKSVRRCLLKVKQPQEELQKVLSDGSPFHDSWKCIQQKFERVELLTSKVVGKMEEAVMKDLDSAMKALDGMKGGKPNGACWSDGLASGATWKTVKDAFKSGKLFEVMPADLVQGIADLQEAGITQPPQTRSRTAFSFKSF
eukprot:6490705-Amphidinium_carterae.2